MIKVGLVGEDPNDTLSVKNLLGQKYKKGIQFCPLARGIRGYQLDNPKTYRTVKVEILERRCDFVIYIRDLDGFASEKTKVKMKLGWYDKLNELTGGTNLLLLNIWELEALIFADIETFNKIYNTAHKFKGDPMMIKDPKEKLIDITSKSKKQYRESHCPSIFSQLNIELLNSRCKCFESFITEFEKKIQA